MRVINILLDVFADYIASAILTSVSVAPILVGSQYGLTGAAIGTLFSFFYLKVSKQVK